LEPPKIMDFIRRGFVTQHIPIIPGELELEVRSIPARVDRIVKDMVMGELRKWEFAKEDLDTQIAMLQLHRLAVGMVTVNGLQPWPHDTSSIFHVIKAREQGWRDEAVSRIRENYIYWDMAEGSFAIQCVGQYEAFMMRIRKQLDTAGLEKTVGNS
jgi:hypothetical protein